MARSVDEVELVGAALVGIVHLYGVALDGYATLTFKVHVVEHLSLGHLNGVGVFQETVGQCALAMVNMGDDAEVANVVHRRWVAVNGSELFGVGKRHGMAKVFFRELHRAGGCDGPIDANGGVVVTDGTFSLGSIAIVYFIGKHGRV